MSERSKNSLYAIKYRHTKDETKSTLTVVAVDFDEAIKKASDNVELVKRSKDDSIEIVGIDIAATIDVE